MRKFNSSLSNKEQNGFIKKVMSDKNIHEIWEAAHNNEDESATSIICDLRGQKSLKKNTGLEFANDESKIKYSTLEEQINKKTMELTCYKSKFCETIQNYQTKIKDLYDLLLSNIMNVNEILRVLNLKYTQISEFQDTQEFLDSNPEINKISEYFMESFPLILNKIQQYRPEQFDKLSKHNEKQGQQIQDLMAFINKKDEYNSQYNEKFKKKIKELRSQRDSLRQELEQKKKTLNEADKMQMDMELKLINRNELNAILKSLFRRIINHEKVCKNVEKLSLEEVQGLSKKKSLKSRESITSEKDREIQELIREQYSPTVKKPPLSPTKRKRI